MSEDEVIYSGWLSSGAVPEECKGWPDRRGEPSAIEVQGRVVERVEPGTRGGGG